MIIRMSHPQHGEMDVYSEIEVLANQKNGWIKKEVPENTQSPQEIPAVESLNLTERYEAKFGKKPHHRMATSTIEAALKD